MTPRILIAALVLAVVGAEAAPPAPALAQRSHDWRWQGDRRSGWDPVPHYRPPGRRGQRRMSRTDWVYRGRDGRVYCRRSDGTTGLVVGGLGGAAIGGAIGGSTLSALIGGIGGAALGSSIDRGQVQCW
jgi:hypothetical protein